MKNPPLFLLALLPLLLSCVTQTTDIKLKIHTVPVLALKSSNEVAEIRFDRPYDLQGVRLTLEASSSLSDLVCCSLFADGKELFSKPFSKSGRKASVFLPLEMNVDTLMVLKVHFSLRDKVDLDNTIRISKAVFQTTEGEMAAEISGAPFLRTGIALRQAGQDGCDNCRIPGLATTNDGTLIAIYDARYDMDRDLQGNIDICCNRSTDGGMTWSPMARVLDMGSWGDLPEKYNGVSDASITVDKNTGEIFVAGTWMYGVLDEATGRFIEGLGEHSTEWNHQWRTNGTQPGYDVKQSSQMLIARSTDDGLSWSEPENITRQVKPEFWWLMTTAPGAGITLRDGTIVIPAQGRTENGMSVSTLISSRDHGKTWTSGTRITDAVPSNECMAVELSDGSLMLNCRSTSNRGHKDVNGRVIGVTTDLGQTWTDHPTSRKALIEPTCQASLLRHDYVSEDGGVTPVLLFFNPNDTDRRIHHTLKCSLDEGQTWPENLWIELDEGLGNGYSCMCVIDNETIGVLYEGSGANLIFQRVKIADLLKDASL